MAKKVHPLVQSVYDSLVPVYEDLKRRYHDADMEEGHDEVVIRVHVERNPRDDLREPVELPPVEATPAAEELAEEKGVDLHDVEGSGKEGRVVKSDVEPL